MSTPSAKGAANVSRSAAIAATLLLALVKAGCYLPSRLMAVVVSLAKAWAVARLAIKTRSASSANFWWGSLVNWAQ
jgi:hypothetical protein